MNFSKTIRNVLYSFVLLSMLSAGAQCKATTARPKKLTEKKPTGTKPTEKLTHSSTELTNQRAKEIKNATKTSTLKKNEAVKTALKDYTEAVKKAISATQVYEKALKPPTKKSSQSGDEEDNALEDSSEIRSEEPEE